MKNDNLSTCVNKKKETYEHRNYSHNETKRVQK